MWAFQASTIQCKCYLVKNTARPSRNITVQTAPRPAALQHSRKYFPNTICQRKIMKGEVGTRNTIELTYSHTIPFSKELVSFILMTKKPHSIICVKDLRCRGCLPKLKMEKNHTLIFNYELSGVTMNNTCQTSTGPPENACWGKKKDYQKKIFQDGRRVLAVLKEFEYNDFVKWSRLFSPLNYPLSIFHEFISAIYRLRNAFAS